MQPSRSTPPRCLTNRALPGHQAENVSVLRPQRHADADIVSALRDEVRDHAYTPTAASSNAKAAKAPSMEVAKRWRAKES